MVILAVLFAMAVFFGALVHWVNERRKLRRIMNNGGFYFKAYYGMTNEEICDAECKRINGTLSTTGYFCGGVILIGTIVLGGA